MKPLKTDEVRKSYLDFFVSKGHRLAGSDSLVPQNDPTLLFTGAGMNQFKEYFLGLKKDMKRATSSQKCIRTGDLENVGRTPAHHSFFEMLGNFSFGDYFKSEAIAWAWEYLTKVLEISPDRLRVSVYKTDDEAFAIWRDQIKIREDWIYRLGDKDNFWPANAPKDGPNGPCGPCSEIYFDHGPDFQAPSPNLDAPRFTEIWNLVFTQFDRQDGGKLVPLANKNIDTGMGLERLVSVLQGKRSNFEIDIFQPILASIREELGLAPSTEAPRQHLYAIADHIRAVVFCMHDGVSPGNEGRGYVVRKLIRRALWHAHQIVPEGRLEASFLYRVAPAVVSVMKSAYPELVETEASVVSTLQAEEERFLDTLETGLRLLNQKLEELTRKKITTVPGEAVFELYDTYGFPEELTRVIAESRGFALDHEGFEREMEGQRRRAKESTQIAASIFVSTELEKNILALPATRFLGYDALEARGRILLAEIKDGEGVIVVDQTPFYGESGGQVGDHGEIFTNSFMAKVVDSQKKDDRVLHAIRIEKGSVKTGDEVTLAVDTERRFRAMRNHTATHLLHAALRKVLGKQVRQLGSLVSPDKLRFDYSYAKPLAAEELRLIEDEVNREILRNTPVDKREKALEEAKADGAMAFFGEKYGDKVRVISIGEYSKELCGGTHCSLTGQIGSFIIVSDASIASGTRRIEALTGDGAIEYVRGLRAELGKISDILKTPPSGVRDRIAKLQDSVKKLEKEKKQGLTAMADPKNILKEALSAGLVKFAHYRFSQGAEVEDLRKLSDAIRSMSEKTVYFLGTETEDKIHYVIGLSPDLGASRVDAREAMKALTPVLAGSGGGRKELAQGGARNDGQFQKRWNEIVEGAVQYLKGVS